MLAFQKLGEMWCSNSELTRLSVLPEVNRQKLAYPANYASKYCTYLQQIFRIGRHMDTDN